jgi:hypothetical protein
MTTFEKTPKELQALPPEKLIFGLIKDYTNANNIDNNTLRQAKLINAETTAEGGKLYDVLTKPVWTTGDYFDKAKFINIKPEALQKDGNAALDGAVKLMQQNINSLGKELDQYDKLPKNYVENKIKSGEFSEEDAKNFVEEYTKKVENFNDKNRALKTVINTGEQFFGDLKRFDYYKATQDKLAKDFNFKQDFVGAAREGSLDNLVDALNYGQQKYAQVQSKLGIISPEQEVAKYLKIASDRDFDYMRYTPDYIKNMQFIEKDPKTGENKLNPRALGHSMIKTTVESYMLYLTGLGISKATGLSRLAGTNKVGDYIAGHAGILPASELYIQPDMFDEAMDKYENGEISLNQLRTLPDYQAGIEGLTEMLFTPEGTVLTSLLTTDSKKLALKTFLKSATGKDVVKTFGKNVTKAVTEGTLMGLGEGWEEVLGNIFNDVYNYNIKADNPDYKYTTQNTLDNNLTTIGNTFVSMLPTMLFGAGTTYLNESSGAVPKTTFYEVAQNPDEFAKYAKDFVYNSSSIKKQFPTKSKDEVWDVVKNTYTNLANTYKQALPILAKLDTEHEKIEYFTATQTINSLGKKPELTKKEEGELNKSLEYISEVNNRVAILDALKEVNPIQFLAKKIESGIESFEYNSQDISILSTIGKSLDNSLKEFENKKGYEKLVDKIKEKINLVNTNIEKLQNKPVTTTQESLINEPKQEEIAVLTPVQEFENKISTASQEDLERLRIEIQDNEELSKEGKQLRKKILERENELLDKEKNVTFTDGVNSVTFKKGEQVTLDEGNSYWNVEGLTEDGRLKLSRKFEKTTESITVSDVNDVKPYSFNEKEKKSKDGLEEPQGIEPIKPEDLEGFSPQEDLEAVFGKPKQIEEVSDIEAKKADIKRRWEEAFEQITSPEDFEELGSEQNKDELPYSATINVGDENLEETLFADSKEKLIEKINAKYNEELKALEEQSTSAKKADIEIGKVGNTEYEVKVDGVYYQGKKLNNPENKTHRQLIEADIERRKQEELANYKPLADRMEEENKKSVEKGERPRHSQRDIEDAGDKSIGIQIINDRYNEELKALEEQSTSTNQSEIDKKADIERRKQALRDLMKATGDDIFMLGVEDGTFMGESLLNMNENGDVVLTRYADSEEGLTKGKGKTKNLKDIAGQFGGEQIATSGIEGGAASFVNGVVGEYHIPLQELIDLIKSEDVVFAGLGNKEFVLSPHIADKYLTKINGKEINAKYDAELKALEQQLTAETPKVEITPTQADVLKALEKFKEDSKKATITDKGYRLLGKIYKRVSDFVLNNISYESNKSVTNIVNAGVTGDYVDLLAREFFKNENISYKEFKDIVELDKKTGKQFVKINTEDTFNAFKKEIASVKKNLTKKHTVNSVAPVFITDELLLSIDTKSINGFDGLAGTTDMVIVDDAGNYFIYDFKSKKQSSSRYPVTVESLNKSFDGFVKSDTKKWTDQQSVYARLLEHYIGKAPVSINAIVVPINYTTEEFEGDFENKQEIKDFKPIPEDLKVVKSPFIKELTQEENQKLEGIIEENKQPVIKEVVVPQEVSEEKPTTTKPVISEESKEFKKEVAETIEKYEESTNQFKSGNNKSSNWLAVVSKLYNQFKKEGLENYRISVVNANTIDFEYLSENTKEYWRKQSIIKNTPINELIAKDKGKYLVLSDKDGNTLYFNEAGEIVTKEIGKPVISNFSDGALISDKETYNKITEARKNNSTHLIDRIVYTPSKLTKKVLTTVKDIIGETPLQIVKKEDNRAYAQIGDEQQPLTSRTLTSNEVETLIALSKNLGGSGLIKEKQPLEEKNNSERYQKAQYLTNLIFSGTGKGKINFELKFGKGENNAVVTIKQTDGTWKTPTESELKDFLSKQWVNINYSLLESPVAFTTYKVEGSKVVEDTIYPSYTEFLKNNVKVPSTEIGDTNAHYNIEVGAVDDTIKAKVIEAETENAKIEIEVQPKEEKEVPLDNTPIQETPPKKIVKKEFKKKSDTKDNPLSGDLFRNRRLDNKVTEQQKQEALSWFKSHPISEFIKLNHFQDIINSDAFASWSEAGITLWSGSNFTDLYHEAWHEFSQLYLTKAQKQALYNEVRNKNFNFINSKGVKVNSLTASDFDIEEYVAEDFYKYVLSSKEGKPLILNNQPKRNSIFRRVYNFLKELVTGNTDLQTYYERLYTGNINNYKRDLNNAFFGSLNVGLKINVDGETKTLTNEETKQLYRGLDSLISNLFEEINQPIATLFAKNNVLSIVYDKIFDKFNEEYENYVDKYNNTTNELEQEALQQTITNLEYTLSNWNNVLAHHKRFSPYFNSSKDVVQFDDENNLIDNEVDEDELTRSSEIDKNNNVSSKEVAANETIYLVATLPRYENGKLAVNPFFPFVNDIVDFNNTWNQLTNTTNNTLDYEQILNKIDKLGDKNHSFKDLLQRIPTKEDILTDAQSRLKSAFINDISKPRIEEQELVLSLDEKGNLNGFYKAAAATDIDTIKKNWFENFNKIEGEYKTENEDSGVISLNTQKLLDDFKSSVMITKSDLQKADKNEIYAKRVEFLNNLGITFSDETILDPQFKDLILSENNPVTGIYLQLKKRLNADEVIINPFKDVAKYQRLLSEAELKHSSTLSTQSVKNPEGNNVWLIRQWNYTSKIYNALNDTEKYPTYQDFQNTPWLKALDENSNPYVKGAFLNSIFDLTPNSPTYGKRRTKNGIPVKLTLESYAGIKIDAGKGVKNEGTNTTSLTAFEKLVQNINTMLLYGVQEHLRYGDKSSSFATRISHVYDPVSKQLEDRSILVPREEFYDYQNKQSVVLPITAFQFLLGDLKAELIPMKRNFQTGLGNNIKNYNKNIKGLGVFEGILSKETFEKLKTQIIENDDVVETKTFGDKETQDISDVLKSLSKDIRTDIENYIEEKSKDLQKELGIKDLKSKELNNILVDRVFYVHSNKTIKNVIPSQIMYAYVVNSLLYNIEHTKIVTQDPRFYSAKGDKKNPFKRFSAWSATGNLFVVDNQTNEYIASKVEAIKDAVAKKLRTTIAPSLTTGEINSVVFKDVVRETKYFKLYIDLLAKTGQFSEEVLKSWYKAYNNITEPDGQGYVTLDELKKSKLRAGSSHWTKAHEEAYQAEADFISGKSTIGMTSEQVALFTPQKWQYAGNTTYSNIESNQQITAPVFYKFSVVPLIPSAIKGTPFEEIHDNLVKQNVGLALFESGSKMSAITDSEGNFNPFYENQQERTPYTGIYTINTINYEHLKEQVNIEPELKEKVTFSTQMRKLLFLNTFNGGVPIDAPKDMTLEQWDALSDSR